MNDDNKSEKNSSLIEKGDKLVLPSSFFNSNRTFPESKIQKQIKKSIDDEFQSKPAPALTQKNPKQNASKNTKAVSTPNNLNLNTNPIQNFNTKINNYEIKNIFQAYKRSEKIVQEGYAIDLTHYQVEDNLIKEIHFEIERYYKMNKIFKIIICEYDYDSFKFIGKPSQISKEGMDFFIKMLNHYNNLEHLSLGKNQKRDY